MQRWMHLHQWQIPSKTQLATLSKNLSNHLWGIRTVWATLIPFIKVKDQIIDQIVHKYTWEIPMWRHSEIKTSMNHDCRKDLIWCLSIPKNFRLRDKVSMNSKSPMWSTLTQWKQHHYSQIWLTLHLWWVKV
jgi:hypothetical protein